MRRLLSLLTAVLAIGLLSALPTASIADVPSSNSSPASDAAASDWSDTSSDQGDDAAADLGDLASNECDLSSPDQQGVAGDPTDDNFGDDTATDDTGATDAGAGPDDEAAFVDDNGDGIDYNIGTDTGDGSSDVPVECDDLGDGVAADLPDDARSEDLTDGGELDVDYSLDQPGDITTTLTSGTGLTTRAVIAKVKVGKVTTIGRGHKRVTKAGLVTVTVKLTKQGKQALRKSKRALNLKLKTHIRLADGTVVDASKPVTIKPPHKKQKGKGKTKRS